MTADSSDSVRRSGSNVKGEAAGRFEPCAHALCRCLVEKKGDYCSPSCAEHDGAANRQRASGNREAGKGAVKYCSCQHPVCHLECDLVMKGGITSGIVYPPLVLTLKGHYHFRNVGGTSAGAIAAAATAAAEFGRETGGFRKLEELNKELGGTNFLRNLFQPSKETRPLMETIFALIGAQAEQLKGEKSRLSYVKRISRLLADLDERLGQPDSPYAKGTEVGFIAGFLLSAIISLIALLVLLLRSAMTGEASFWWLSFVPMLLLLGPFTIIGSKLGGLIYAGLDLYKALTRRVPENYFGICTGMADERLPSSSPNSRVLTSWLHEELDDMAGIRDPKLERHKGGYKPLTFGDLRLKELDEQLVCAYPRENNISLQMVTSNLNQNQPYVLPFKDHLFIFKEEDFLKLFPKEVVAYMKRKAAEYAARRPPDHSLCKLPAGHYFLPDADDLPVIVATRMSLSFPLLLSAIPLYSLKPSKIVRGQKGEEVARDASDLQLNWFSDGGIASNFPIHFFDSWLPTRPTFGVNLTSLPKEGFKADPSGRKILADESASVAFEPTGAGVKIAAGETSIAVASDQIDLKPISLPAPDAQAVTEWKPLAKKSPKEETEIPSLPKFLWAIFETAQNYRDNAQAMLPSYRERVVQIRLSEDEGGLNLAMPEATIQRVMKKGVTAGKLLLNDFDFGVHQWVRFRVLMKQMEASLKKIRKVTGDQPAKFDSTSLLTRQLAENFPFNCADPWSEKASARLSEMNRLVDNWIDPDDLFAQKPHPEPEPVLRVAPEL